MSLQFVLGGSGSGKSTYVFDNIIERSMKEENKNFLVVVPDQFTMQTQMDFVNRHPRGGILNIDILSFSRLSHRILEETGGNRETVLDDTGKSLVLRKVAEELKEEVPVLGANLKKLGYIHEVKSAISEFMQYGIGNKEIQEIQEKTDNIEKFIRTAKKYVGIEELTPAILNDMVKAVYVQKPDKSSGKRVQKVIISYNYAGILPNSLLNKFYSRCTQKETA